MGLSAIRFLHLERHILFHGHEPLDTDTTATLEGESWLMHNGYAQAEGVAHLDQVAERGCLITIGYPKFGGGVGGYARYVAICPAEWSHGVRVGEVPEAPLPRSAVPLGWDSASGGGRRKVRGGCLVQIPRSRTPGAGPPPRRHEEGEKKQNNPHPIGGAHELHGSLAPVSEGGRDVAAPGDGKGAWGPPPIGARMRQWTSRLGVSLVISKSICPISFPSFRKRTLSCPPICAVPVVSRVHHPATPCAVATLHKPLPRAPWMPIR